jgi:predicted phosphohydrolase
VRLFAISDLHLPGGMDKSMDRFGPGWVGHFDKISADWRSRVTPQDWVLLPGDLSWAMAFDDALADIDAICALPDGKICSRATMITGGAPFRVCAANCPRACTPIQE